MNNHIIETETFLENLRNSTSQSHTDLENLPVSLSITNPAVTLKEYTDYLSLMHDVVKDAEQNIFNKLTTIIPDLDQRTKAGLIEEDLLFAGINKTTNTTPLSHSLPNESVAFALGIMYVIEGSTLGGRFILKNITQALGLDSEKGAKYFAGYGNTTGSHWKNFLNYMVKYQEEHKCENEIIEGANFAFNEINRYFSQVTPQ